MELTATQVSLLTALIALAAPAITYRAVSRPGRDRWVREELRQDGDPWWRRIGTRKRTSVPG